jgi:RNA polymerase sigma-70 factor (ECF subfamily)
MAGLYDIMEQYNNLSDIELTALLREGDEQAFTEIFNRYNRLLFVHAHKLLNDEEEARDLVQEIFVLIWDNRESLHFKHNFSGFLYTSIRNRIFDLLAHKKVESKYLDSIGAFFSQGIAQTDHLLRSNQLQVLIEKEIGLLPPKMREIFELSRKENMSHKAIALELDLSEKTVRNQINNALKILRIKLGLLIYLYLILHL